MPRIDGVVFEKIPSSHEDERRTLTAFFNMDVPGFEGAEQLKMAVAKQDCVLGRHYHDYAELFFVITGEAFFKLEGRGTGRQDAIILPTGYRLLIPPLVWHEAQVERGTLLLCLTEMRYVSPEHNDHRV